MVPAYFIPSTSHCHLPSTVIFEIKGGVGVTGIVSVGFGGMVGGAVGGVVSNGLEHPIANAITIRIYCSVFM